MQSLVPVDSNGNVDQNGDPAGQPPTPSPGPGPTPSPSPSPVPPVVDQPPNSQPPVCKHTRHDDDDDDEDDEDDDDDDDDRDHDKDDSDHDSADKVSPKSGDLLLQTSLKSQFQTQCTHSSGGNKGGGHKDDRDDDDDDDDNDDDDDDPRCYESDEAVGCILLEGHGKSLKLALLTTGGLGSSQSRVDSVCVPKTECLNAVAQAFKTRTQVAPGSHGYCKHNKNVKTLKAPQVRALLPK